MALPINTATSTNDPAAVRDLLNLPPSGTDPYSSTGQLYFANQANIIISNSSSGVVSAYFQDTNNVEPLQPIPYDVTTITQNGSTYMTNQSYSFVTNASFYDFREKKTANTVQLNVGALNSWLNSTNGSTFNDQMNYDTGHNIDSVYVYNGAPASSTTLPSVRVANGATLPSSGLTVVTPDPLYVLGNYNANGPSLNNGANVANTAPAALIGDAITVLSPSWSDSYSLANKTATNPNGRAATATTVNAATFEGIVPSTGNNYSGGVENFLRLLENWSGKTLTYNGSIVVMFPSQYATNNWVYGGYYTAPNRAWAFDVNFMSQGGLPPLTPKIRTLPAELDRRRIRGARTFLPLEPFAAINCGRESRHPSRPGKHPNRGHRATPAETRRSSCPRRGRVDLRNRFESFQARLSCQNDCAARRLRARTGGRHFGSRSQSRPPPPIQRRRARSDAPYRKSETGTSATASWPPIPRRAVNVFTAVAARKISAKICCS